MPPVNWIQAHQNELQAISGLAIAVLTMVLIIVTAIYARANWLTMRLMEADVRFRTKPIPRLGLTAVKPWSSTGPQPWQVTLRTEHAPLCLIALSVQFVTGADQREHFQGFKRQIIVPADSFQHDFKIDLPAPPTDWTAQLYYRDHAEPLDYLTTLDKAGFVSDHPPINRRTLWNRIRFWFGVQRIKRQMGMK